MTSDEVYKLIEANGLTLHGDIEHFAALVASAEREACAKTIESLPLFAVGNERDYEKATIEDAVVQILARGQA
jgi:hypothetical protein